MDTNSSQKKWRQLLRVLCVDTDGAWIVVPGWNSAVAVRISQDTFPVEMHEHLSPGRRFYAQVNIGAECPEELVFSDFEIAPEPDLHDGLV